MSKEYGIEFLGGDFRGHGAYFSPVLTLPRPGGPTERMHIGCCKITQLTAENSKSMGGAAAAGLAGGLLLGPAGLLAGALAGGNKQSVSFVVELEDGRKTVGQAHPSLYARLIADGLNATCLPVEPLKPGQGVFNCLVAVVMVAIVAAVPALLLRSCG